MKEGITAYIIENNLKIRKVTVAHIIGNMALVKFVNAPTHVPTNTPKNLI